MLDCNDSDLQRRAVGGAEYGYWPLSTLITRRISCTSTCSTTAIAMSSGNSALLQVAVISPGRSTVTRRLAISNNALRETAARLTSQSSTAITSPVSSFLQVTLGWFLRDPRLAMLQTPHYFYSPGSL